VKKKIGLSVITTILLILFLLPSLAQNQLKLYVNGNDTGITPAYQNGIVYVPVQSLALPLGISVKWDPSSQTLYVNDQVMGNAVMISGVIHVPVETLTSAIGAAVELDGRANAVKITTGGISPVPTVVVLTTPVPPPPTVMPTTVAIPPTPIPTPSIFIPKTEENDSFRVTVTNLQYQTIIKNYYTPKAGYRFCIVNVSQQNISPNVQIYTGSFTLFDTDGHSYDYLEGLSNFWLQVLQPGGTNFGHLVYEIPAYSIPEKIELTSINNPSLTINLQ